MKLNVVTALLVALPSVVFAQDSASQQDKKIVVTGCVERAHRNGSLAGTPVGTSAVSPNTADDDANSQAPVDRYLLTGATVRPSTEAATGTAGASSTSSNLRSYALKGHDAELREHNGHRVEITGTVSPAPKATLPPDRASLASGVEQLTIESLKMVGASCSGS
jgi:hypothetical protein